MVRCLCPPHTDESEDKSCLAFLVVKGDLKNFENDENNLKRKMKAAVASLLDIPSESVEICVMKPGCSIIVILSLPMTAAQTFSDMPKTDMHEALQPVLGETEPVEFASHTVSEELLDFCGLKGEHLSCSTPLKKEEVQARRGRRKPALVFLLVATCCLLCAISHGVRYVLSFYLCTGPIQDLNVQQGGVAAR